MMFFAYFSADSIKIGQNLLVMQPGSGTILQLISKWRPCKVDHSKLISGQGNDIDEHLARSNLA
jgi:hypothetical protein